VIHGCGGEQDIRKMGRLHRKMPITSVTFAVATLAISGFPFLSGFYSKDLMLASMLEFVSTHRHWVLFAIPALAASITAFYMMRLYLLTFFTAPRDEHVHHHAHESPKVMWVPLAILAVLSIVVGWGGSLPDRHAKGGGEYEYAGGSGLVGLIADAQPTWAISWQMEEAAKSHRDGAAERPAEAHHGFHTLATIFAGGAMAIGFAVSFLTYYFGIISPANVARRFKPLYTLLVNKYYVDELYRATFVAGTLALANLGKWIDRKILDGIADGSARWVVRTAFFSGLTLDNRGVDGAVNGAAELALASGNLVRRGQTGRVRTYVLTLAGALAAVILLAMFLF